MLQVTIHGQRTVLCAHASALDDARRQLEGREPSPDLTPAAAAVSALLVGQNATAAECGSHSVLSASVRGVADSMLTIDADPLYEGPPGTQLAIGQRLFVQQGGTAPPMRPSLSLKVAKDISEVAFPLAMRAGSAASNATKSDNIIVDVPVTLTLADGITSVQHLLKLGLYYSANVQHDTLVSVAKSEAESAPVQQMDLWPQDPMNSGDCRACPLGSWTYRCGAARLSTSQRDCMLPLCWTPVCCHWREPHSESDLVLSVRSIGHSGSVSASQLRASESTTLGGWRLIPAAMTANAHKAGAWLHTGLLLKRRRQWDSR